MTPMTNGGGRGDAVGGIEGVLEGQKVSRWRFRRIEDHVVVRDIA